MNKYSKDVEVRGHLIDSMILTKIFDNIMDLDGKFEVTKIKVGKLKTDESFAKIKVIGKNQNHLNEILEKGSEKADLIAKNNLKEIYEIIGLTKFT